MKHDYHERVIELLFDRIEFLEKELQFSMSKDFVCLTCHPNEQKFSQSPDHRDPVSPQVLQMRTAQPILFENLSPYLQDAGLSVLPPLPYYGADI